MTFNIPLAEQLRPSKLEDYIGQKHILGEGAILRQSIEKNSIPSMILWGPPGVGKTTLAYIISQALKRPFFTLSAVSSGVKDVRSVIDSAKQGSQAILFIDEIHRFSKSQQDSLLSAVEKGFVILIGATTENPSFEVISPLLSRCQIYILKPFDPEDLKTLLDRALTFYKKNKNIEIKILESEALFRISGGDARKLLNAIELMVNSVGAKKIAIDNKNIMEIIQQNLAIYDKGGEMHYDVISAFIKSLRGSDPNASVYWLARMVEAGEDIKFIARRMLIMAAEDIGNANPNALLLANTCFDAVNKIGWPESRIILSQTAIYLASSPKSNASYMAIQEAEALVKNTGDLPVPIHLRNAPTQLMKDIGYGKDYKYAHQHKNNFIDLEYFPEKILGTKLYDPGNNARENEVRKFLSFRWKKKYNY